MIRSPSCGASRLHRHHPPPRGRGISIDTASSTTAGVHRRAGQRVRAIFDVEDVVHDAKPPISLLDVENSLVLEAWVADVVDELPTYARSTSAAQFVRTRLT
jgi:hypothetical protein